ncbi:helix-turn-helix domain-containing protein [Streptomyces mirabilis]
MNGLTGTGTGTVLGTPRRKFSADVVVPRTGEESLHTFLHAWKTQVGEAYPLPPTEPGTAREYRVRIRGARMHDAVIADLHHGTPVVGGTGGDFHHLSDQVVMHVVRRGAWHFDRLRVRGGVRDRFAVSAGQFVVRHNGPSWRFAIEPDTSTSKLNLPLAHLGRLVGERPFLGSADSAEVRLLLAHAHMVDATLDDLSPAGVQAARNALIELVTGVLAQKVDAGEPQLAPSLVRAAKDLMDSHLADPELSPSMLARRLSVSVRTLHRAFTATDESVTACIRHRRLEQARLALTAPVGRPSVSELAAAWHFADSSHFIRAFKKWNGQTPAQYAKSHQDGAPNASHRA